MAKSNVNTFITLNSLANGLEKGIWHRVIQPKFISLDATCKMLTEVLASKCLPGSPQRSAACNFTLCKYLRLLISPSQVVLWQGTILSLPAWWYSSC